MSELATLQQALAALKPPERPKPERVPPRESARDRRARLERDRLAAEAYAQAMVEYNRRRGELTSQMIGATTAAAQAKAQAEAAERRRQAEAEEARRKRAEDRADAERRRQQQLEDQRRQAEEQRRERLYQVGIQAGAVVGGVVVGKRLAKGIEARHIAHLNARSSQLSAIGYRAQELLKGKGGYVTAAQRTQLAGLVRAADRAGLTRIRGPLGIGMGGMLIGEALFARMVIAPKLENPVAREAVNQLSTASVFAATNLISTRMIQNRTLGSQPSKQPSPLMKRLGFGPKPGVSLTFPNAKAIGAIEAARLVVNERVPQTAVSTVSAARTAASRVAAATSTASMVRQGIRSAISSPGTAAARQAIARAGRYGAVGLGVAALGYGASQTEAGRQAIQWVRGFFRTSESGRTSYVRPHQRRVA